jgi:acetoin utilization deacetylase AcuC-like enzyme
MTRDSDTATAPFTRSTTGADAQRLGVYYSPRYNATAESVETVKKADRVAMLAGADDSIELREPTSATFEELAAVHDPTYVSAVKAGTPSDLARSNGLRWDALLFDAAASSTGGMRDAALAALAEGVSGTLSSGLHHAARDRGKGYCTFNGLVVAARAALGAGAARILILDLDAHAGGGTAELMEDVDGIEQVDVAVSRFDSYPSRPSARLTIANAEDYLPTIVAELERIEDPGSIDLVLYNAGVDPHQDAGGVAGITNDTIEEREALVFKWAAAKAIPIAFTLAGGYRSRRFGLDDVAALHRITLDRAVELLVTAR